MPGITWYTSTQVPLCTYFVFQGTTSFAASYISNRTIYEPYRVSWAELREDLHRRKAFRRTARMSEERLVKFAHLLRPAPQNNDRLKYLHTWYLIYEHQVLPAVHACCISRRHLLRPAPRTGTSSALGWDRLPSTVALSLCKAYPFAAVYTTSSAT